MNCHRHRKLLKTWIDGELDSQAAARVEGHVRSCAACRAEADDFRRLAKMLSSVSAVAVPYPDLEGIRRRISTAGRDERRVIRFLQRTAAAAAALLVVATLAGGLGAYVGPGLDGPPVVIEGSSSVAGNAAGIPREDAFAVLLRNLDAFPSAYAMEEY